MVARSRKATSTVAWSRVAGSMGRLLLRFGWLGLLLWTIYLMYFDHEKSYVRSIFRPFYCFFNIIVQSLLMVEMYHLWNMGFRNVHRGSRFFFANCYHGLVLTSCVSDRVHQRRVLTSHVSDEPHQRRVLTRRVSDVGHQRRGHAIRVSDVVTSQTRTLLSQTQIYRRGISVSVMRFKKSL